MKGKKLIGKMLENIAVVSTESASIFFLYEPEIPKKWVEERKKKSKKEND